MFQGLIWYACALYFVSCQCYLPFMIRVQKLRMCECVSSALDCVSCVTFHDACLIFANSTVSRLPVIRRMVLPSLLIIANDIFAYIFGFFLGRRFFQRGLIDLSPKKTWEGFIGATVVRVFGIFVNCKKLFQFFRNYGGLSEQTFLFLLLFCSVHCIFFLLVRLLSVKLSFRFTSLPLSLSFRCWYSQTPSPPSYQVTLFFGFTLSRLLGSFQMFVCPKRDFSFGFATCEPSDVWPIIIVHSSVPNHAKNNREFICVLSVQNYQGSRPCLF